jgi:hypothetical protein
VIIGKYLPSRESSSGEVVFSEMSLLTGLIDDRVSSVHSFEWQSEIRPEMEISEEISSSYDGSQAANDNTISGLNQLQHVQY